jgi:hypothetical protein
LQKVAQLIAGNCPPKWLEAQLKFLKAKVIFALALEKAQPGRSETRRRLQEINRAAQALATVIEGGDPLLAFLEASGPLVNRNELFHGLRDLADRAERERAEIPVTGGRGKAWVGENELSAQDWCALIVAEAWVLVHELRPAPSNDRAIEAADAYWQACGGPPSRWRGYTSNQRTGWRKHFQRAAGDEFAPQRDEIHGFMSRARSAELNPP